MAAFACTAYGNLFNATLVTDFETINRNIERYHPSHWAEYDRVANQALRRDAMILEADRTPVDVVQRRTQALLDHLGAKRHQPALDQLKQKNKPGLTNEEQRELFFETAALRRTIAFSNPLMDFNSLLFLKHNPKARGDNHMVDQYLGMNQSTSGGVFRLDHPFTNPQAASVLNGDQLDHNGSFISLDLDYDAGEILFAYTALDWEGYKNPKNWTGQPWNAEEASRNSLNQHYCFREESAFHIFKAKADGSHLKQLTTGQWDDFDPVFLPNGRMAFISARAGGTQRCGYRFIPTYTLFGMMPDGSDIQQFSWHDTNEWQPSVNHDGMLVYTRWDYVDRDSDIAHHLWFCYPDGRDPRSMHGNYPEKRSSRPWMEMSIRAVPGSHKYIAVAAPHHGEAYGSLVLIDQSLPDDRAMSQVKRITPLSAFPESEVSPGLSFRDGKGNKQRDWHYGTPWPLSEDFHLCVYSNEKLGNYGIYLVDSFGNRELIYRDPEIACLDPIPLRPRKRPPSIPIQTQQMKADRDPGLDPSTGTISVMNVYEGEFPIPEGVKIKELRIVNVFPK
ncbi:TolB family protein [Pontiella sp.]|uniref:TolB family protein n=1 Tax=Pontiella sp. TaxID=2837462 RepID=UPI003567BDF8